MATLKVAMPYLISNEGFFSNTSGDAGGESYIGISRKNHPEWPGWAILDTLHLPTHLPRECNRIIAADARVMPLVIAFYLETYWRFDNLRSQMVAEKLFDLCVNCEGDGNHGIAIRIFQQAVNAQCPNVLGVDGSYGAETERWINTCNPQRLLMDVVQLACEHYRAIVAANPGDAKFLPDWLGRARKLPAPSQAASA